MKPLPSKKKKSKRRKRTKPQSKARLALGQIGENLAASSLERSGFCILGRNIRISVGEIDILARDGETIVIVEVKTLRCGRLYDPIERIDVAKQRKLQLISSVIAARNPDRDVRIDAVAVYWENGDSREEPTIRHIQDIIHF